MRGAKQGCYPKFRFAFIPPLKQWAFCELFCKTSARRAGDDEPRIPRTSRHGVGVSNHLVASVPPRIDLA